MYRASRDGWGADAFYSKCRDKVNTITVIKSTEGNVFGGYLDSSWQTNNILSDHAFLFFLKHDEQLTSSIKMRLKYAGPYAAFNGANCYGFGQKLLGRFNLIIFSNANSNMKSYIIFDGQNENISNNFSTHMNAQKMKFQAAEIEVFELMS